MSCWKWARFGSVIYAGTALGKASSGWVVPASSFQHKLFISLYFEHLECLRKLSWDVSAAVIAQVTKTTKRTMDISTLILAGILQRTGTILAYLHEEVLIRSLDFVLNGTKFQVDTSDHAISPGRLRLSNACRLQFHPKPSSRMNRALTLFTPNDDA